MAAKLSQHIYCDSLSKLQDAVAALRQESSLAIDCEGYTLGRPGGELTLLQIATKSHTYVIDIKKLSAHEVITELRGILADKKVTKIFWDCRKDCAAICAATKEKFDLDIHTILDLQLAEVALRRDTDTQRNDRLKKLQLFQNVVIEDYPDLFRVCHRITGLVYALRGHRVYTKAEWDAVNKAKLEAPKGEDSIKWQLRPLQPELLNYAAMDARSIWDLHVKFRQYKNYSEWAERIMGASRIYMQDALSVEEETLYNSNALLPLNVAQVLLDIRGKGKTRQCKSCHRVIDAEFFIDSATRCALCKAIDLTNQVSGSKVSAESAPSTDIQTPPKFVAAAGGCGAADDTKPVAASVPAHPNPPKDTAAGGGGGGKPRHRRKPKSAVPTQSITFDSSAQQISGPPKDTAAGGGGGGKPRRRRKPKTSQASTWSSSTCDNEEYDDYGARGSDSP